ncbi:MAG: DUF5597 domain-containing protein [Acidobacteria bacterium]|nr:DUF5597 domain-containing protein [Acidobacteriota bacterium]
MRLRILCCSIAVCALAVVAGYAQTKSAPPIPHLEKRGGVTQLIVDGKPFLMLAGELRNSSSSSLEYMKPIWPKLARMHLNTVLAVVSWESIEAQEGKFDFALVDGLLRGARANSLRLVLLWFGSWKNGISRYTPPWVKANQERFPLVQMKGGKTLEILSTLSAANRDADARAFAALMRHIRQEDSAQRTVIMVQLENEVGVLGDSRDRSPAANEAFAGPAPAELLEYLRKHRDTLLPEFRRVWEAAGSRTSGTWEEVFGKSLAADEIFMAWNYARYINRVAEAGKAEYRLPMFVNAWIVQPEDKGPGDYPSGGPVDHVHDVWRAGAPLIDILAPDIYLPNFPELVARYSRAANPAFIPESRAGAAGAANAFYAFGQHGAMGYSPFGIEEREDPEKGPIPKAYAVLAQLAPQILEHQSKGSIAAVWLNKEQPAQKLQLGNYTLNIELRRTRRAPGLLPEVGSGIFIAAGPDEYIAAGTDVQITFSPNTPGPPIAGLATVEEGTYVNGRWVAGRVLNGDEVQLRYDLAAAAAENQSGSGLRFGADGPAIQRVRLYRYR